MDFKPTSVLPPVLPRVGRLLLRARHGVNVPFCVRPNGSGDPSPGLRPKADALGRKSVSIVAACKVARTRFGKTALAAFQAAARCHPSPQGIGLRPQPWAPFSRPVGPDGSRTP